MLTNYFTICTRKVGFSCKSQDGTINPFLICLIFISQEMKRQTGRITNYPMWKLQPFNGIQLLFIYVIHCCSKLFMCSVHWYASYSSYIQYRSCYCFNRSVCIIFRKNVARTEVKAKKDTDRKRILKLFCNEITIIIGRETELFCKITIILILKMRLVGQLWLYERTCSVNEQTNRNVTIQLEFEINMYTAQQINLFVPTKNVYKTFEEKRIMIM